MYSEYFLILPFYPAVKVVDPRQSFFPFACHLLILWGTSHSHFLMGIDTRSNSSGPLRATKCLSFWVFCTFGGSQDCSVDAFTHQPPLHTRIVNRGARQRRQARIPSILLVKSGKDRDMVDVEPFRKDKLPTRKLLEEEKRQNYPKTVKKTASLYQTEFLSHDILTADDEKILGKKIRKAMALKEEIRAIIEEKEVVEFERFIKQQEYTRLVVEEYSDFGMGFDQEDDFSSLVTHGLDGSFLEETRRQKNQVASSIEFQPVDQYMDDLWATKESSKFGVGKGQNLLSDKDLDRLGGREKVSQILIEGAVAREKMISSNIRLVLSVAKKWCKSSSKSSNGASDNYAAVYGGGWTRPSLDEAVQEGIIGLATAADRFDYTRNLRFSTYATYWIVNFVRRCFQNAATGSLRVPQNYHLIRQQYQQIVMSYFEETGGGSMPMLEAATAMRMTVDRLRFVLKSTESLISLDSPIPQGAIPSQAGKAGSPAASNEAVLGDSISCTEPLPEDRVEISFLRQCLENALSSELSPHERDVVRLRYGLDDGNSRTVKETSKMLTVTASQVRRAENSAFRKLRSPHSVHTYNLLGFLDYIGAAPYQRRG